MIIERNDFNITSILECGQLFRYEKLGENHYIILANNRLLEISQEGNKINFINSDDDFWLDYFDLNTNYHTMQEDILNHEPRLAPIIDGGLRILNQNHFETIISFICSQNWKMTQTKNLLNNISKFCGDEIIYNNKKYYEFPSIEKLKNMTIDDFKDCKSGFRNTYLYDAIQKINQKEIDLNTENIFDELLKIKGVGNKVASCITLFGYHDFNIFPIDTWIRKFMIKNYFDDEDVSLKEIDVKSIEVFGQYRGLAQQYIFKKIIEKNNIFDLNKKRYE